jgi:hypothetical protein
MGREFITKLQVRLPEIKRRKRIVLKWVLRRTVTPGLNWLRVVYCLDGNKPYMYFSRRAMLHEVTYLRMKAATYSWQRLEFISTLHVATLRHRRILVTCITLDVIQVSDFMYSNI